MTGKIVPFRDSSRADELWRDYISVVHRLQSNLAALNIDAMRACVAAYDAFMAEYTKEK